MRWKPYCVKLARCRLRPLTVLTQVQAPNSQMDASTRALRSVLNSKRTTAGNRELTNQINISQTGVIRDKVKKNRAGNRKKKALQEKNGMSFAFSLHGPSLRLDIQP